MVAKSILFLHRFLKRRFISSISKISPPKVINPPQSSTTTGRHEPCPTANINSDVQRLSSTTLVFDLESSLLMSPSTFPYFMLVAIEAGGFLRALILLLFYPLVWFLGEEEEMGIKLMAFISFCGLKKSEFRTGRAVLPKHFFSRVSLEASEIALTGWRRKVCISSMPGEMVETFLKEYLGVEIVVANEMKLVGGYYTGFMENESKKKKKEELVLKELSFGHAQDGDRPAGSVVGFTGSSANSCRASQLFFKCKEVFMVTEAQKRNWHILPKEKYSRPVVFHDGRIAFLPTAPATLAMFMWIPFGLLLALFRAIVFFTLPRSLYLPIISFTGMEVRVSNDEDDDKNKNNKHLFVCNHRTLLDPVYISSAVGTPMTAVTYSLSKVSEFLSPMKTVRLTRNREEDKRRMVSQLEKGNLVVCPEGTTCREQFLLRFSPLFTEIIDELTPVALDVEVDMFYGTTAGGLKCFDPLFFLMNPSPKYHMNFLRKMEMSSSLSSIERANMVQSALGEALGFECTSLTRKDKYLMLAGNEGFV